MEDTPLDVKAIPAGDTVTNPRPGDFFLVHQNHVTSKLIQFGQRMRYSSEHAYWNHTGLFVDEDGGIIESIASGPTKNHISKYEHIEYIVVRVEASEEDRAQMVKFAEWAVGHKYGYLTDISLGLWCLLGGSFSFSLDGQLICSGLVARALERAGYIFERDTNRETPADLARHFKVHRILAEPVADNRDDVIPLNDVPAFGVQFRFAYRTIKDTIASLRRSHS